MNPHDALAILAAIADLFIPVLFLVGGIALIWIARHDYLWRKKRK